MIRVLISLLIVFSLVLPAFADGKKVDDGVLTDRVRQRLVSDPEVKGHDLDVEVKDGVVTLAGQVESERAKAKAEKVTRKVNGVRSVVNNLQVVAPRLR